MQDEFDINYRLLVLTKTRKALTKTTLREIIASGIPRKVAIYHDIIAEIIVFPNFDRYDIIVHRKDRIAPHCISVPCSVLENLPIETTV